eukprot:SAG31_NODE_489_length_14938_cov_5.644113_5_plen_121_part_00
MGNAPPQCCPGVREQILLKRRRTIVHGVVEALDLADGTLEQRCAQYKLKEATISLIKWKEAQKDGKRAIAKSLEILFDSKILFNQEVRYVQSTRERERERERERQKCCLILWSNADMFDV